jgi:hypothetical protein
MRFLAAWWAPTAGSGSRIFVSTGGGMTLHVARPLGRQRALPNTLRDGLVESTAALRTG